MLIDVRNRQSAVCRGMLDCILGMVVLVTPVSKLLSGVWDLDKAAEHAQEKATGRSRKRPTSATNSSGYWNSEA